MERYPRQLDAAPQVQELQRQMAGELKHARKDPGPIEAGDIQDLLAAIAKYEARDKLQVPADRSTKGAQGVPEPTSSPTRQPGRVASILDSLSTILVSKPRHQIIAIALRADEKNKTLEFILAANYDIPSTTSSQLTWIWNGLVKISSRYHHLYPTQDENTPKHDIQDAELRHQIHDFACQCVKFHFAKIQNLVDAKLSNFLSVDRNAFGEEHPFTAIRKSIRSLEEFFTREQGGCVRETQ